MRTWREDLVTEGGHRERFLLQNEGKETGFYYRMRTLRGVFLLKTDGRETFPTV